MTQKIFKASSNDHLQHEGPVTVIRPLSSDTDKYDEEVGPMFRVRSSAGVEFDAFEDELQDPPASASGKAFDKFIAQGRSDWPDIDGNLEQPLRAGAAVSPEEEQSDDAPDPITLSEDDITIERNDEHIDVRMHDDTRPEHWPTIFASHPR